MLFVVAAISRIATRPEIPAAKPEPLISHSVQRPILSAHESDAERCSLQIPVNIGQAVLLGSLDQSAGMHSVQLTWLDDAGELAVDDVPNTWPPLVTRTLPEPSVLLNDEQRPVQFEPAIPASTASQDLKPSAADRRHRRFVVPFFCGQLVHDRVVMATEIARGQRVSVYLADGDAGAYETDSATGSSLSGELAVTSLVHSQAAALEVATDIIQRAEQRLLPFVEHRLCRIADLDGDGRLSLVLAELSVEGPDDQRIEPPVTGCVRPDDFRVGGTDLNHDGSGCDIVYLTCRLPEGEERDAVLAHEFAHAATFCLLNERPDPLSELPGWLNEAIAHVIEHQVSPHSVNLKNRLQRFIQEPSGFPLVIPDGLPHLTVRRGPARAAACLFLNATLPRHSDDCLRRLVQSSEAGVGRLEYVTGRDFRELFRDWGLFMMASTGRFPEYCIDSDQDVLLRLAGTSCTWTTTATQKGVLHIQAPPDARLQITIVNQTSSTTGRQVRRHAGSSH
ncbi:MAG: hypothetical protein R3C59_21840 [Planctomycetaceae bacterium]